MAEEIIKEEVNPEEETEFTKMVNVIRGSGTFVPSDAIIGLLSDIVLNTGKDSVSTKECVEVLKKDNITDEHEIVSRIVLYTCNTFIYSLWRMFKKDFIAWYKTRQKQKAELEKETSEPTGKPQA